MKHTFIVTAFLVLIFILAQVVGLALIAKAAIITVTAQGVVVVYPDTAIGPRPDTSGGGSLVYVVVALAVGTGLLLLLMRYQRFNLWKLWFFLAVWLSMTVSFGVFLKQSWLFEYDLAILCGLVLAVLKVRYANPIIHNASEILMYAGIALILVPLFDLFWVSVLLAIIAFYDMYAVWKSEHMVRMAQFQTKTKLFAGLLIPYGGSRKEKGNSAQQSPRSSHSRVLKAISSSSKSLKELPLSPSSSRPASSAGKGQARHMAVLGGGDIAFPLIFSGVVLQTLLDVGYTKAAAFVHTSIIIATVTLALIGLFVFAKKNKFYPAMPFLAGGCFVGLFILWLAIHI